MKALPLVVLLLSSLLNAQGFKCAEVKPDRYEAGEFRGFARLPLVQFVEVAPPLHARNVGGKVVDPSGAPIPTVLVEPKDVKGTVHSTRTNKDGYFGFRLPRGKYVLWVTCSGFNAFTCQLTVDRQGSPQVTVQLSFSA
jgi:hypothetical protein